MTRLAGKVAIITGAAKGIGAADAKLFAAEGAKVILSDIDCAMGNELAEEIGGDAEFHEHNVCEEKHWQALIEDVMKRHGQLDILVNNAGVVHPGTIETQTTEQYRNIMAVSSDATFFGCKYAVKAMKEHGRTASIINMASTAAVDGESNVVAYCGAKGAVEAMTRAVAVHCIRSDYPIRCNAVLPGTTLTPMVENIRAQMTDNEKVDYKPDQYKPIKIGEAMDIANTVLFLASDESKHLNGASIRVDYGSTITPR